MCHESDGSGALPNTPDFSDYEISALLRGNSGENLCIIAEGQGAMLGWKETLTVEDMWQVLTYTALFAE
jgi:mono/diheme cytochrome c family protein